MFEAGEGITSIAKKPEMPSKQAISQRALKDGWQRLPSIDRSSDDLTLIPFDGLNDEQRLIVQEVANGATQRLAAEMAGHHETTISDWKKSNPKFARAILAAKAAKVRRRLAKIDTSPDWRAAGWLMERDPDSRDEFSPPNAGKGLGQTTFNVLGHVNVGFDRDDDKRLSPVGQQPALIAPGGDGQQS